MKMSYVLSDPVSYRTWTEFEGDLACVKEAGYDAVELQIADPAAFDEDRVRKALNMAGLPMCAFQTGGTYATRGNCVCTADTAVRQRTLQLLRSFVNLAGRWNSVIVLGSLQGRLKDEPDRAAGGKRIRDAIREVGEYAVERKVTIAFEPVNHLEIGFHNTIAEAAALVRAIDLPSIRLMVDTFHMNIEEKDMVGSLAGIRDILAHVHLCETNRGVLGEGHWDTRGFLAGLRSPGYGGYCSIGVYNTRQSRRDYIRRCMDVVVSALNRK